MKACLSYDFVVGVIGSEKDVWRFRLFPVAIQSNVVCTAKFTNRTRRRSVGSATNFPPALTAMVVLVIDREASLFHHRTNPSHAMVAIIVILRETVANEKSFRRTSMHINTKDALGRRRMVSSSLVFQSMAPIFFHAWNTVL